METSGTHTTEMTLDDIDLVVEIEWVAWEAEARTFDYPGCDAGIAADDWDVVLVRAGATQQEAVDAFRAWAGDMDDSYSQINLLLDAEVERADWQMR